MILFWVVAGLLSVAAAGLILSNAARAAARGDAVDPTLAVYRRQLAEIDDLAERGLIASDERKGAHAEAARRLLVAAGRQTQAWRADPDMRRVILAVCGLSAVTALVIYLAVGSPGASDQPFNRRVEAWGRSDLASLTPPQMAAVLQQVARKHPADPEALRYLAIAEQAADNPMGAERALHRAIRLAPARADLWEMLGQVLITQSGGPVTPEAKLAFVQAVRLDPKSVNARFYLAQADIEGGDKARGLAAWRALAGDIPAIDPRRDALLAVIKTAENGPQPPAATLDQMAMIRGMVQGLAARLETNPDDPQGWVRLVRAYAVLGDAAARDGALAKARARYAGHADLLRDLDAAARTEPMS